MKEKSLTIGNDKKKPKWFYAYGLNTTYEENQSIEELNTIIIAIPKNTIITKKDIYIEKGVINKPSKRSRPLMDIESMNRYLYDKSN
ncbi:MAG: hypothetical protein KAI53_05005, partial [Candidatus Aenigmarchaeota archaeon]|nr:hypothetical protein [Candidatus Aenigmarchaeota archaeon]